LHACVFERLDPASGHAVILKAPVLDWRMFAVIDIIEKYFAAHVPGDGKAN
jgi:hypothetical protein